MDSRDQLDADFEQASKYLKDLAEVYAHQHDTSIIEEIHSLKRQLAGAFQSTQTNVKDTIAALQRQVENSKKTTVRPEDAGFFKQRMADLDAQRQAVLQGIAELSQEKAATLEQIQALRVKTQAVKEAADQLDAEQAARIPQVKHTISLYASITGIKWDYNSKNIAGYIMPQGRAVKSFSISEGAVSDFELANSLWEMIGEAHGLAE